MKKSPKYNLITTLCKVYMALLILIFYLIFYGMYNLWPWEKDVEQEETTAHHFTEATLAAQECDSVYVLDF